MKKFKIGLVLTLLIASLMIVNAASVLAADKTTTTTLTALLPTTLTPSQTVTYQGRVTCPGSEPHTLNVIIQSGPSESGPWTEVITDTIAGDYFTGTFAAPTTTGTYYIRAYFPAQDYLGNHYLESASAPRTIYVTEITALTVSCTPDTVDKEGSMTTTISGTLTAGGVGVGNKEIKLFYNVLLDIATVQTAPDGSYSYTWTVPDSLQNGFYQIIAAFAGDSNYRMSSATTTNTTGGGGLFVVPEYALGGLAAIGACFVAFAAFKKRGAKLTSTI